MNEKFKELKQRLGEVVRIMRKVAFNVPIDSAIFSKPS